jgi:hypothetical protein
VVEARVRDVEIADDDDAAPIRGQLPHRGGEPRVVQAQVYTSSLSLLQRISDDAIEGVDFHTISDTETLITAFRGLTFDSPFGKVTFRPQDHQSTMGAYVGKTTLRGGKGEMKDYKYYDGTKYFPSDAEVKKLRPAD